MHSLHSLHRSSLISECRRKRESRRKMAGDEKSHLLLLHQTTLLQFFPPAGAECSILLGFPLPRFLPSPISLTGDYDDNDTTSDSGFFRAAPSLSLSSSAALFFFSPPFIRKASLFSSWLLLSFSPYVGKELGAELRGKRKV